MSLLWTQDTTKTAALAVEATDGVGEERVESAAVVPSLTFNDGNTMPQIGLGVYRTEPGQETFDSVLESLKIGYRLFDTAMYYENEEDVGRAIAAAIKSSAAAASDEGDSTSDIFTIASREDVFITTKLSGESHGYEQAMLAAEECLRKLNTPYIDLLLMHSPYGGKIVETWDALLELKRMGKVKSIGVSNFGIEHLEALREHGRPKPVVNQIELHPLNYMERKELIQFCHYHDIRITAYGSLFSGHTQRLFVDPHPLLQELAIKYEKTIPQILLRWAMQQGFAIIPKSIRKERLEENFHILDFDLTPAELEALSAMEGEPLDEYWNPVKDAEVHIGDLSHRATWLQSADTNEL